MRINIVACRVLTRELSALVATCENDVDVTWLPQGLHETPALLHTAIEEQLEALYRMIDRKMQRRTPDYIVLGYGLCSQSIVGIQAKRIPLVVPRTDDCLALFFGSQQRYLDYFERYKGTYWLNSQWVRNVPDLDPDYDEKLYAEYLEQYEDEDTAQYLLDMHKENLKNYRYVGYVGTKLYNDSWERSRAKEYADRRGLEFLEKEGNNRLLQKIVKGEFDDEDFLTVPVGYQIAYSNGPERMVAIPAEASDSAEAD